MSDGWKGIQVHNHQPKKTIVKNYVHWSVVSWFKFCLDVQGLACRTELKTHSSHKCHTLIRSDLYMLFTTYFWNIDQLASKLLASLPKVTMLDSPPGITGQLASLPLDHNSAWSHWTCLPKVTMLDCPRDYRSTSFIASWPQQCLKSLNLTSQGN